MVFEPWCLRIGQEFRLVVEMFDTNKITNVQLFEVQKSQNHDTSPLCDGATCEPVSVKFDVSVRLTNGGTCIKTDSKLLMIYFIYFTIQVTCNTDNDMLTTISHVNLET